MSLSGESGNLIEDGSGEGRRACRPATLRGEVEVMVMVEDDHQLSIRARDGTRCGRIRAGKTRRRDGMGVKMRFVDAPEDLSSEFGGGAAGGRVFGWCRPRWVLANQTRQSNRCWSLNSGVVSGLKNMDKVT